MPGEGCRDHRQLLALRFHQHVGQAVAIAIPGDAAGQHEDVGVAVGLEHRLLRRRSLPADVFRDLQGLGQALQVVEQRPAADVMEAPVHLFRQQRQRLQH